MAKLIYSLDGAFLGEFPLEGDRLTIGRRLGNDIHIDNLAISGEHAVIETVGRDVFVEDLGSTNGTVVNGQAIKRLLLRHGDVIELGKYQLKYVDETHFPGNPGPGPADYEKTAIIRPVAADAAIPVTPPQHEAAEPQSGAVAQAMQKPPSAQPPALPSWARPPGMAAPAPEAPRREILLARIQVLNGLGTGKALELSKEHTTVGITGMQVAVIARLPQGYSVRHVEGLRHPLVNGHSIGAQEHHLSDHDVIEIAGVKMEFHYVDL
ncbi:glycogen accumulation regulator GarA [mine drainage metagenome]|uniref:Glycogen accumulation regulator GarA n=1 Tax=mine drainage metagenome TaxID=410659 RepID=A0A1J5R5B9_9ZZZZ